MGKTIELTAADGTAFGAYRAPVPDGRPKGGIVVVQEIFGVNAHIRSVADRFAAVGYTALAPAIFDPVETGVELAYDDAGMKRGSEIAGKIPPERYRAMIEASIGALADEGPVAIAGFCLGGSLAYLAATRDDRLAAAVCYYGGMIARHAGADLKCPVLMHFGETDAHIPLSDVERIRAAHPDVPIHTYPAAGHGFNCDARASYHKPSADLAWERTIAFLDRAVGTTSAAA